MNFANAISPLASGLRTAGGNLPRTLLAMSQGLGIVVCAGSIAAATQLMQEEGRNFLSQKRNRSDERRRNNTKLILLLSETQVPLEIQDKLRKARDVVKTSLALLTNPKAALPLECHSAIRSAVARTTGTALVEVTEVIQ